MRERKWIKPVVAHPPAQGTELDQTPKLKSAALHCVGIVCILNCTVQADETRINCHKLGITALPQS